MATLHIFELKKKKSFSSVLIYWLYIWKYSKIYNFFFLQNRLQKVNVQDINNFFLRLINSGKLSPNKRQFRKYRRNIVSFIFFATGVGYNLYFCKIPPAKKSFSILVYRLYFCKSVTTAPWLHPPAVQFENFSAFSFWEGSHRKQIVSSEVNVQPIFRGKVDHISVS